MNPADYEKLAADLKKEYQAKVVELHDAYKVRLRHLRKAFGITAKSKPKQIVQPAKPAFFPPEMLAHQGPVARAVVATLPQMSGMLFTWRNLLDKMDAAVAKGVSPMTMRNIVNSLVHRGAIELVEKGDGKKMAKYRLKPQKVSLRRKRLAHEIDKK